MAVVKIPVRDSQGLITRVVEVREDDPLVPRVEELELALGNRSAQIKMLEVVEASEVAQLQHEIRVIQDEN